MFRKEKDSDSFEDMVNTMVIHNEVLLNSWENTLENTNKQVKNKLQNVNSKKSWKKNDKNKEVKKLYQQMENEINMVREKYMKKIRTVK